MVPTSSSFASDTQYLTAWLEDYRQPNTLDNNLAISLTSDIQQISYMSEQYNYGLSVVCSKTNS